jgi:heme exporter protein D
MAFDSLHGFLSMRGYAAYVWPAWSMAFLLLLGLATAARGERRRLIAQIRRRRRQAGEK